LDEQKKIKRELKWLRERGITSVYLLTKRLEELNSSPDESIKGSRRVLLHIYRFLKGKEMFGMYFGIEFLRKQIIKLGGSLMFLGQEVLKKNKIIKMRKLIKRMRMTKKRINEHLKNEALFDEKELALTVRQFLNGSMIRFFDILFFLKPSVFFSFFEK